MTVRRNGEDVTVSVVTGLKGDSTTEIVSGLSTTDQVVLPVTVGTGSTSQTGFPAGGPPGGGLGGGFGGGGFGG